MKNKRDVSIDKELTNEYLNKVPTICRPWSIDKKLAKILGSKERDPHITLSWCKSGVGFGEFTFYNKKGKIYCNNETMSKEFIKEMLCKMVDDCILTEV